MDISFPFFLLAFGQERNRLNHIEFYTHGVMVRFIMSAENKREFVIIAGEVSGDHHGANLVKALKKRSPDCKIWGIGGDRMVREGFQARYHIRQMAFMGIWEVIRHLPFIRKVLKDMTDQVEEKRPDAVILIDYPGFNLRFARAMKDLNVPVIYYISPQLWAWGRGRIKKIRSLVDRMLVIFPFEADFYARYGVGATYVGHPLVDTHYREVNPKETMDPDKCVLGLMPGSRQQELEQLLPDMLKAVDILMGKKKIARTLIAAVDHLSDDVYRTYIGNRKNIEIYRGPLAGFYNTLDAALVSSGTATLETAYFQVPMVIVYRVSMLTWLLGKMMIKLKFIGLVNIIAEEKVSPELLQYGFTPEHAAEEINHLLDPAQNQQTRKKLKLIQEKLGKPGASERTAAEIEDFIRERGDRHA